MLKKKGAVIDFGLQQLLYCWVFLPFYPLLLGYWINAALCSVLAHTLITNNTVDQCEQRIIAASAAVQAGMDVCAALTIQDVSCQHELSVCTLGSKTLGFAVTTIVRGAGSFFVCKKLKINLKHAFFLRFSFSDPNVFRVRVFESTKSGVNGIKNNGC